jgi:hypothetical protein
MDLRLPVCLKNLMTFYYMFLAVNLYPLYDVLYDVSNISVDPLDKWMQTKRYIA